MLVDQKTELDELVSILAESVRGSGHVALIEGPSGCGKSELMATFADLAAARGVAVLSAGASESDCDVPFSTLRRLSSKSPSQALSGLLQDTGSGTAAFWADLLEKGGGAPLVCCVDDLHYADASSLKSLHHLVRLGRTAPVLLVLSQANHFTLQDSDFSTELLRMRNVRYIQLSRLGRAQVTGVVRCYPDLAAQAADHAAGLAQASGGNPLLLRALIAEQRNSAAGVPTIGGPFSQALVTCVRRSGRDGLRLAAAVAVLGEQASASRLADLLDITTSAAAQGLAALAASGVVNGTAFRHPVGRAAVLDYLSRKEIAVLHRRIAELLHSTGATQHLVAQHLIASFSDRIVKAEEPWVVEVLCATAEQAISVDDTERAVRLLEHAHAVSPDPLRRGEIKTRLAAVTGRVDPTLSEQHLNDAFETLSTADATAQSLWPLAQLLVAQGRITDAIEIRNRTLSATDALDLADAPWARNTAGPFRGDGGDGEAPEFASMIEANQFTAIDASIPDIERFLASTSLAGPTLPAITQAITALTLSEDPQRAVRWSRVLLEESMARGARGWQCVFTSALAHAQLRLGDLREAERHALAALELIPNRRRCTFSCTAVATLISARTEMRDLAGAAAEVDQPVPAKLFHSVHGLSYLRARGRYLAATNQLPAALEDFFEAGRIMKSWNLDRPIILPWRTEAAEVLRRLGETQAVDRLVLQQLSTPDARHPWIRGITLRLRAATSAPKKRSLLLQQAVGELRKSGDRVELARTLGELGEALKEVEDPLAGVMSHQAISLATDCGADALLEEIRHRSPSLRCLEPEAAAVAADTTNALHSRLSESERRVAALAALKYTNREISKLLHVTVSTVEQHLTNVYRKLQINGRRHLPANLDLYAVDTA